MRNKKAEKLYSDFHKYDPECIEELPGEFVLPTKCTFLGPALYVLYQSSKKDPITYEIPNAPQNYIHEHKAGVGAYVPNAGHKKVPKYIHGCTHLVYLGKSLGFGYIDKNESEVIIKHDPRKTELYAIPSGKALLIADRRTSVSALIWGGSLNVEPRGIVG